MTCHSPLLPQVVCRLLSLLPAALYSEMLDWLHKFSRNTKIGYRVFALDVFGELLQLPIRTGTHRVKHLEF